MSLLFVHDYVRRIAPRGWRTNIWLVSFFLCSAVLFVLFSSGEEASEIVVVHNPDASTQHPSTHSPVIHEVIPPNALTDCTGRFFLDRLNRGAQSHPRRCSTSIPPQRKRRQRPRHSPSSPPNSSPLRPPQNLRQNTHHIP